MVFSGAGWRGEAHRCLVAMARRRIFAYATNEILDELRLLTAEISFKTKFPPDNLINWFCDRVTIIEPTPLGKQRSRDDKDDQYLACALAAAAKVIVSRDDDLLTLEKPFGIEIITPRELLVRLSKPL
jgi:putative PIN family toxin of toxin-antitoxin system